MTDPALHATWVCFDIGETLIDETRVWANWARLLGVTELVLMATMGAEIAAGRSYSAALERLEPGWRDLVEEAESSLGPLLAADLYDDAIPSLAALQKAGVRVAVIGNQPVRRTAELRAMGVPADVMVMSDELDAQKPDLAFFAAALSAMGDTDPGEVLYVGDRMDNDVHAATRAGIRAVHLLRGPWGIIGPQDDGTAVAVVDNLTELVDRIVPS